MIEKMGGVMYAEGSNTVQGRLARPEGYTRPLADEEEMTSGLEEFIEWERMEEALVTGQVKTKYDFKNDVRRQFEKAGWRLTRQAYRDVLAGMFPEFQEMYAALPSSPPEVSTLGDRSKRLRNKLTVDQVREIRSYAANGESLTDLAEEYGVKPNTICEIVNRKTWRHVA